MGSNLYVAASGAMARLRDLDVVSNNLANSGTPGFKREESIFRSVLESSLRGANGILERGAPGRSFVSTESVAIDFSSGSPQNTGSAYHAMIDGPGFFEIQTAIGPRYSRAGNFVVNTLGELALPGGQPVQGDAGPIVVGGAAIEISPSGEVSDGEGNLYGKLKVVRFPDVSRLLKDGRSLFAAPADLDPEVEEDVRLIPESIEASNVVAAQELAGLVILQRAFEASVKALQMDDQNTERLIEGIR